MAFSRRCFLYRADTSTKRFCYSFRPTEFIKNQLFWTDSMMNFAHSVEQAPADRLTEIGELLAQALMRLQSRKSSAILGEFGESSLHFTPDQSGDAEPCSAQVSR
jgi:hypothetical protein